MGLLLSLSSCASTSTQPSSSGAGEASTSAAGATATAGKTATETKGATQAGADATKPQPPPAAKAQLAGVIACSKAGHERAIEVHKIEGGCWLMYHNGDIKKRVAWSRNGIRHCESVRDNIRSNLEKSGWACTERTL